MSLVRLTKVTSVQPASLHAAPFCSGESQSFIIFVAANVPSSLSDTPSPIARAVHDDTENEGTTRLGKGMNEGMPRKGGSSLSNPDVQ